MLHVCFEIPYILIAVGSFILLPLAFSLLYTFLEFSDISRPSAPPVLAKTIWFPKSIIAFEAVTVLEDVRSLAMLETILPLSFVSVAVTPSVDTVALNLAVFPLAHIVVTIESLPDTLAMLHTLDPLSIVHIPISPSVNPFAFPFVPEKLP